MDGAQKKRSGWRLLGLGLVAGLGMAAAALGSAVASPDNDDYKYHPEAISTEPLFPADDGPKPTAAQAELATRITAIQTNGGGTDPSRGSPPYQIAHGILGISGAPAKGYTVILAKGTSVKHAESTSFSGLSKDAMQALTLTASDVTVEEITAAWDAVVSEGWVAEPGGKQLTYSVRIADAKVVVGLGAGASEESRKNLAAISTLIRVLDTGGVIRAWSGPA